MTYDPKRALQLLRIGSGRGDATFKGIDHVEYFNLDVIISVGYRVKSRQGTQFRIWATERLREYLVKGFTMDDARIDPYFGLA